MRRRRVLLVEPGYRNKYPPLGLMKIAAYHRKLGDQVRFVKGLDVPARQQPWDRIYITTLFSFDWNLTVETIRFYKAVNSGLSESATRIYVGGIAATVLKEDFARETGIEPTAGRLSAAGALDSGSDLVVDEMVPDYSILSEIDYEYRYSDAYIGYATRGCSRRCRFCAVPRLEPQFIDYIDIKPWVNGVREQHGEKQDLILLDNNILASTRLVDIAGDIRELGFEAGAKLNGKSRHVDFNQGLDARLLSKQKMAVLADLPIEPFRLAYDNIGLRDAYARAVRTAAEAGVTNISAYVLYNYRDTPEDFWDRLHHNVELSENLGVRIWSFPMKYIPVTHKDRCHVGPAWNARYLRGVQCITLVTRGAVSARHDFFHAAFGRDHAEFREIASMPDRYIIYRREFALNGAAEWLKAFRALSKAQREELLQEVSGRSRSQVRVRMETMNVGPLRELLGHYCG